MSLADRIRSEGDTAARPGQMTALHDLAREVEALESEAQRLKMMLNELGFCPKDGDAMPCMTCGAGL